MKVVQLVVIFMVAVVFIITTRYMLSQNRISMAMETVTCSCPPYIQPVPPSTSSEEDSTITPEEDHSVTSSIKPSTFLLIMMPIRPGAFEKRMLIRNTWYKGYKNSKEVMLRFAVGTKAISEEISKKLSEENSSFRDVAFVEQRETPRALTNKTIAMIKWASDNINFTYMMKCDEDTYVYVDNAVSELKKRPTTTNLYYGKMIYHAPVMKDRKVKWGDPHWDLGDTYMPYALGGGYILSSDLVGMLAEQADYLKWHPNEDTAVGSWLVPYEYEQWSDELVCVSGVDGTLKYKCVEKFPMFHIYYSFPLYQSAMMYFHKLYNEYLAAKKEAGT